MPWRSLPTNQHAGPVRQLGVTARPIPTRHWRSYGTEPLPTGREALDEPFRAFPSWFVRATCDRCAPTTVPPASGTTTARRLIQPGFRSARNCALALARWTARFEKSSEEEIDLAPAPNAA